MAQLDWRTLDLDAGVLREPVPEDNRVVFWLTGPVADGFRHWERIGSVPGSELPAAQGLVATAATAIRARQRVQGFFGKLLERWRQPSAGPTWVLPNGSVAEQVGPRQTDLLLVWADPEALPFAPARIAERWPQASRIQKIAGNLFLVAGVEPPPRPSVGPQGSPRQQAEERLAAAREARDCPKQALALTDLGVACLRGGEPQQAVQILEDALAIACRLRDRALELDVLGNLGLAVLATGRPGRARELLEQHLVLARAAGDRIQEKLALDHLGLAHAHQRDHVRAHSYYAQALPLARAVGHRQHEADLLWFLAIQDAELGRRDQAVAQAQAAIALYEEMGHPQAGWLGDHLERYRRGESDANSLFEPVGRIANPSYEGGPVPAALYSWSMVGGAGTAAAGPVAGPGPAPSGPGLLRMAMSAVKSMTRFIGSGGQTVAASTYRQRLQTCAPCEQHTGVRCKVCGCFTSVKARLPHESCPLSKWPRAVAPSS